MQNVLIQARNLVPAIGDYSTSEQDTGFKWVDGKTIYKKTVFKSSLSSSGETNIAHGVTGLSECIKIEAFSKNSSTDSIMIPTINFAGSHHFAVWKVDGTNINVFSTIVLANVYVTIWYTKTS